MKKLLTLFAVLALTAPVLAADGDPNVLITIVDEGGGVVQVNYQVLVEDGVDPGLMRGIALKLTTSNTALFDAISNYATGSTPADSENIPAGYSIFMGSIQFAADPNFVSSFGDPVAPSGDPGAGDDLPDAAEIVVELGSLYAEGGTAPGTSGTLFKLTLDDNGEASTVLGIEGESTRGGDLGECVMEDGTQANIVLSGVTDAYKVSFDIECYVVGQPRYYDENMNPGPAITQANYDAWVAAGKPACWCCPHHGYGDVNGDGAINPSDVPLVWNPVKLGQSPVRADVNHDGSVNPSDVPLVWNTVKANVGPLPNTCPDCP